ncbi:hypothetical protein XENOCAPTIV_009893, partial [Xenoophorus captivus]
LLSVLTSSSFASSVCNYLNCPRPAVDQCQQSSRCPFLLRLPKGNHDSLRFSYVCDHHLCRKISHLSVFSIAVGGKLYENSHSHAASETASLVGSTAYKRSQPSSSGLGMGAVAAAGGEDGVKKKKKGNWRNRFGPCFTTDAKPSEAAPSLTLPTSSSAASATSSSTPSTASSTSSTLPGRPGLVSSSGLGVGIGGGERGLGVMGVGGGIQKSPSLLRNGSLQSNSSSTTTGSGETHAPTQDASVSEHGNFKLINALSRLNGN